MFFQALKDTPITTYHIDFPDQTGDITLEIVFRAGYYHNSSPHKELPHLLEHYLNRCLENEGFDCHARTNLGTMSVVVILSKEEFFTSLPKILSLILNNSLNNQAIFDLEKKILLNELAGIIDDSLEHSYRLMCNQHLSDIQPCETSIDHYSKIELHDLQDFYKTHCTTDVATLFIGSYESTTDFHTKLSQCLQAIPSTISQKINSEITLTKAFSKELSPSNLRSFLRFSWLTPSSLSNPRDQIAINSINSLLSRNDNGLLWKTIRDGQGFVYDLEKDREFQRDFGLFSISMAIMPGDYENCIAITLACVEQIKNGDYSDDLLHDILTDDSDLIDEWNSNAGRFSWIQTDLLERDAVYDLAEWQELYKEMDKAYISKVAQHVFSEGVGVTFLRSEKEV